MSIFDRALNEYKLHDNVPTVLKHRRKQENPLLELVKKVNEADKAVTISNVSTLREIKDNGKYGASDKVKLENALRKAANEIGRGLVFQTSDIEGTKDKVNVHFKLKEKRQYKREDNTPSNENKVDNSTDNVKVEDVKKEEKVVNKPSPVPTNKPFSKPVPHAGRR